MTSIQTACNLCGSTEFSPVYQLEDCSILTCNYCSLIFKNPLPSEEEWESLYRQGPSPERYEHYYKNYYKVRMRSFSKIMKLLLTFSKGGKILDVGCATGWFLEVANKEGFQPYGIDLLEKTASQARAKFGMSISVGKFEEADYQTNFFDVITLLDVLEHSRNPKRMLHKAHSLLREGGFFVVRVPVTDALLPHTLDLLYKLTRGEYYEPIKLLYRVHLYGFSQRTLERYLEQSGFAIAHTYRERSNILKGLNSKKWAKNPLTRASVKAVVRLARLLNMSDQLVVFARKETMDGRCRKRVRPGRKAICPP